MLIKTMKEIVQLQWKDDLLSCNMCEFAFPNKMELIHHKNGEHGQETSVVCEESANYMDRNISSLVNYVEKNSKKN